MWPEALTTTHGWLPFGCSEGALEIVLLLKAFQKYSVQLQVTFAYWKHLSNIRTGTFIENCGLSLLGSSLPPAFFWTTFVLPFTTFIHFLCHGRPFGDHYVMLWCGEKRPPPPYCPRPHYLPLSHVHRASDYDRWLLQLLIFKYYSRAHNIVHFII